MKKLKITKYFLLAMITFTVVISSCNKSKTLEDSDKKALLFMLEEEKLARDTYTFLDNKWSIEQFAMIKNAEQKHMDAIASVLDDYDISYTILPAGEFAEAKLQALYDQFEEDGVISDSLALRIGATVEDVDIQDLLDFENASSNDDVINVFSKLRCGSRNHMRKFTEPMTNGSDDYTPQFISLDDYISIVTGEQERCGNQ